MSFVEVTQDLPSGCPPVGSPLKWDNGSGRVVAILRYVDVSVKIEACDCVEPGSEGLVGARWEEGCYYVQYIVDGQADADGNRIYGIAPLHYFMPEQ